jgi:NAD(P)-dependent dehydrogenase (short-subunit alcohol dehydrogenase family)
MTMESGSQRFADKVAVVTGGASGIGLATTRRLVAEGGRVVVADLDAAALASVADDLGAAVATVTCDVAVEADVEGLVETAMSTYGRLDIAFANAGIGSVSRLADLDVSEWSRVLDVNLTGPFLLIKHASPVMTAGGSIIVTASLNAVQAGKGMGAYCASKAGVAMLVQVAAMELGAAGIRVNAVAPGLVMTPLTEGMTFFPPILEGYVENTPLGRYADPEEIASLVAFLASDEAGFISGSLQLIDGGAHTMRYPDIPGLLEAGLDPGS